MLMRSDVSNGRTTIAVLCSAYGGDFTSVDDLLVGFDRSRYEVVFLYLGRKGESGNHLADAGFKVVYLSDSPAPRGFNPFLLGRLVRALKANSVDILHCHAHKATVYGTLAAWMACTPVVCAHVHGLNRSRTFRRRLINRILFRRIDLLLPVAQAVRQDILANVPSVDRSKVVVLENSIEFGKFADVTTTPSEARALLGLKEDAFVFGTIGRLAPTKGLEHLLGALALVRRDVTNAILIIVGRGPQEQEIRDMVRQMKLDDAVIFAGYRRDVEQLIRGFDVFVMASIAEGMPRVILESMAAGVPCIATSVGGIPEILNSPDVGLLALPADADSLAEAMKRLAAMTPEARASIAGNARERARTVYSHTVVREKLRRLYEGLLTKEREDLEAQEDELA
jgi:glycosyltransferase involved in cell wall biosynthesis